MRRVKETYQKPGPTANHSPSATRVSTEVARHHHLGRAYDLHKGRVLRRVPGPHRHRTRSQANIEQAMNFDREPPLGKNLHNMLMSTKGFCMKIRRWSHEKATLQIDMEQTVFGLLDIPG